MKILKTTLVLLFALLLILLPMTACGTADTTTSSTEQPAAKITITVKIVHKDKTEKTVTIETDKTTLLGALLQENLVEGEDQTAGYYVTAVDGETADWSVDQGWWCFTKGGVSLMTGADSTTIADGEVYEITYTVGY